MVWVGECGIEVVLEEVDLFVLVGGVYFWGVECGLEVVDCFVVFFGVVEEYFEVDLDVGVYVVFVGG